MSGNGPLLSVDELTVEFAMRDGSTARVIDRLGFDLKAGETLGIVGESGCGKSMTALAIMRLIPMPPGRIAQGAITLGGEDLIAVSEPRMRQVRGNDISMVFQEPMTSLNPVYTIGDQIAETVRLHEGLSRKDARDRAIEMLQAVAIPAAESRVDEYAHQLSGGMRQRVMIAMALACRPKVLIADEPTTALDVTVQAQIFDLLKELQERTNTAIVLITHDMGAIAEMAQRVLVMYAGRKVEEAAVDEILASPQHPYTRGLIACVPHLHAEPPLTPGDLMEIPGVVPSVAELSRSGCSFAPRCSAALARCAQETPRNTHIKKQHEVACWLHEPEPTP
ncbi:MAG: ABC transporter ATP-binding protein [Hyphomicrobiaceae bacterium]